ncbi:type II toxin-antitoxin system VapC family toxin [uncultured Campylobacter sp.]|jgi:PIN domain protein|uniref:type II toxin-antitoxin system VapC family toxin n=1 Tax=uncultured Campylobacter sp. TaxID=218934 RepID=UPI002601B66A|nr:type II toxin-antitoxin system VapC family toxin [uncultured Campylobacter sp.]
MSNVFLDTNVMIDFLESTRPNHQKAQDLVESLLKDNHKIVISENSLSDIAYICRNSDIDALISIFEELTFEPSIIIASFGVQAIRNACSRYKRYKGDFEDYLQYFCAEKESCVVIYTSDVNFPQIAIPVKGYDFP